MELLQRQEGKKMDQAEPGEVLPRGLLIKMRRQERKKRAVSKEFAEFERKGAKRKWRSEMISGKKFPVRSVAMGEGN